MSWRPVPPGHTGKDDSYNSPQLEKKRETEYSGCDFQPTWTLRFNNWKILETIIELGARK